MRFLSGCATLLALAGTAVGQALEFEGRLFTPSGLGTMGDYVLWRDVDGDGRRDRLRLYDDGVGTSLEIALFEGRGAYRTAYRGIDPNYIVPGGMVCGDIDGDGRRDVIYLVTFGLMRVLNTPTGFVSGGFQPIPAGSFAIELADMDGDGDQDLVMAGFTSSALHVMTNSGSGNFTTTVSKPVGNAPRGLAVGDLDGDGDVDAVTANTGSGTVSVLLGLGNGDFAPAVTYPVGAAPSAVRLSDVDGDGDLDIVASNFGSANLSVLQNLSNGSFLPATTYGTGPGAGFFDVADLNGDGAVDIAVSTRSVPGISVLFNAGSGSFQPVVSFGSGPYAEIAAVDVDDDGDIDLTPVGGDAFLGNGSGSFAPAAADPFPTPNYPSIVSGDLDGDGDLDLAITTSAGLSTRLNLGSGSFAPAVTTPYAPGMIGIFSVLRLGDFDGDGDLDAVVTWNGSIFVHFNQGNGTMGPATTLAIGVQYWYVQLADVNGDGRPDILGVGNGQVYAAMGTSSGPAPFAPIGGTASNGWTFADMDGDGDLDEVFSSNGALYYSRNNGAGVLGSIVQIAALPNASAVSAADLDGDGLVDVVASVNAVNLTGSRLFKNLGAGSFAPPIALGESNVAPEFIDFDHDGDLDLLCNLFDYALLIENLGSFQFAPPVRIGAARSGLTHLDLDVDGDEDLVGCANGGVFVLENRAVSGTPYCLGDGSATACPCGNSSPSGAQAGCVNSGGRAGKLVARGSTSLLTETARLEGSGMTNSSVLYFQGTTSVSGGAGFVFGDGLRCVGGSLVRLGVAQNSNGASIWPPPNGPSLREAGHVTAPGARFYQAWYRDAQNYCTPATFDLSNGWRFVWRP